MTSIKEMKAIITQAGMSIPPGTEKSELITLTYQAESRIVQRTFPKVHEFGAKLESCRAVFVLFHGLGADEHQFDFLSRPDGVAFVAPKSASLGWWPLDVAQWAGAMSDPAALMRLVHAVPPGLPEAREAALLLLRVLRRRNPDATLLLGGFSQGACFALELALGLPVGEEVFVASFSALATNVDHWTSRVKERAPNMHVLLTHGQRDMIIPFQAAQIIQNLFIQNGLSDLKFVPHGMDHTLGDANVLKECDAFFARAVATSKVSS